MRTTPTPCVQLLFYVHSSYLINTAQVGVYNPYSTAPYSMCTALIARIPPLYHVYNPYSMCTTPITCAQPLFHVYYPYSMCTALLYMYSPYSMYTAPILCMQLLVLFHVYNPYSM